MSALFRVSVVVFGLIFPGITHAQNSCLLNMLPNGDFEGGNFSSFPAQLSVGDPIPGGWYNAEATVDINSNGAANSWGPVDTAANGDQWVTMWSGLSQTEAIAVDTLAPFIAGETYSLSFSAAVQKFESDAKKKTSFLEIYLTDQAGEMRATRTDQYELVADIKIKGIDWKTYEVEFTPGKNADKLMILHRPKNERKRLLALDGIVSEPISGACEKGLCGPDTNNLVMHSRFETQSAHGGWETIFRNHDNRRLDANSADNTNEVTKTPVKDVHSTANGNTHWEVLTTMIRPGICFFCGYSKDENGAVEVQLTAPTIPGQTYRFSFMGATRNPLLHKRAHVNVGLRKTAFCEPGAHCSGNSWDTEIPLDVVVMDNEKLDGKAKEWVLYHADVTVPGEYEYLVIQAQDGVEPAIDDVCLTSDPFLLPLPEAKLYFVTNTSLRQVALDKSITTVAFDPQYDLFGLTRQGDKLIAADNSIGFLSVEPLYTSPQLNPVATLNGTSLATDLTLSPGTGAFFAANYAVRRIVDIVTTPGASAPLSQPAGMASPFSTVHVNGHLIVAGADQLSIINLSTGVTRPIQNHGIQMAGFMDLGDNGALYIADPASNAVRHLTDGQLNTLFNQLALGQTPDVGSFPALSQDGLLGDALGGGGDHMIRGPIGVDHFGSEVWVSVDTGSGQPGRIVRLDDGTGAQTPYLDGLDAPRDLVVWQ